MKREFTVEELEDIDIAIIKWQSILSNYKNAADACQKCHLCDAYGHSIACQACPLKIGGHYCFDRGTVWDRINQFVERYHLAHMQNLTIEEIENHTVRLTMEKLAKEMLEVLRGLKK